MPLWDWGTPPQKLKHFVTDTLNFKACAHLMAIIFATVLQHILLLIL